MLREIRLYGELGKRFGRVHHMAVQSVGEAVRALMANHRGFEQALLEVAPGYRVWTGTNRVADGSEVNQPSGAGEVIRIAPAVAGAAKQGVGQIIMGAVLVAAAVVGNIIVPGNPISPYLFKAGAVMILGGVSQMLSPQPDLSSDSGERQGNVPSYVFNGPINTTAQGHPVPVGYGRMIVGSAVISAGLATQDIPINVTPTAGDWLPVLEAIFGPAT